MGDWRLVHQIQPSLVHLGLFPIDPLLPYDFMPNALANETSPYLLQHQDNPVNWMPWGSEALAKARSENKLIFLSIGYSACHWCHVMEHESFEDEQVAALLNESYIPIKVDREERPDLDEIYMTATMVFSGGHGGWPMSVFLAPDLKPVFAGTYFPKEDAQGRPGIKTILRVIGKRWSDDPSSLTGDSDKVVEIIRQHHGSHESGEAISPDGVRAAAEAVLRAFDRSLGGITSDANKFPPSPALDLFLRTWRRTGTQSFLSAVELTLEKMGDGGIYDHLGGGIHRYSTDPNWLVPHFEKMLYDQALVAAAYADAYQATTRDAHKKQFADRARGICDYVLRDLSSPDGAFHASEDADSEGLEGKFYVWTRDEVAGILGDERTTKIFCSHYDISEYGNWMHPGDDHVPAGPKNILHVVRPAATIAQLEKTPLEEIERLLSGARARLLAEREKRICPGLDDKILSGWNGLMIGALARVGAVLGEPRYLQAAARAADFVLTEMRLDGRLCATWGKGRPRLAAYATDYAFLIDGLLELFEATGDFARLQQAAELTDTLLDHYWDADQGGFFLTADDHEELLVRSKTAIDGATPSANSVMLGVLLKLAELLNRPELGDRGDVILRLFGEGAAKQPFQSERLLANAAAYHDGLTEIVLAGSPEELRPMVEAVRGRYVPDKVLVRLDPAVPNPPGPLYDGREPIDGRAAAYVCRDFVCDTPVTDPSELARRLDALSPGASDSPGAQSS